MALLYARPSDEIGHLATVTLTTGTANALYPVTRVTSFDPMVVFLTSSSGTAVDILWDHGTATDAKLFSLHHYNIPAGTNVRIQRNATNSWGGPTMDGAVVMPTYPQAGLPLPVGVDLTAVAGYSAGGFRYSRLHVPSLAQLVGIGSALLWSQKRTDLLHVRHGATPVLDDEQQPTIPFRTAYGRRPGYRLGVRHRAWPASFRQRDAGWTAFLALFRDCGGNDDPFLWWSDSTNSDAWLAALADDRVSRSRPYNTVHDFDGRIEELPCGLAIPTA